MNIIPFILQVLALVCLLFAAFGLFPPKSGRPSWFPLGMFLWLLSLMVTAIALHPIAH